MSENRRKKIQFTLQNHYTWLDEIRVQRVLPNKIIQVIGPFVLLEHTLSYNQSTNELEKRVVGNWSHPCRGIVIVTYILNGEVEHKDSMGNHVKLTSGSAHWINAGRGIVRCEALRPESEITNQKVSVIRFWINLPSTWKSGEPEYFSLLPNDIPKKILTDDAGWIKILTGEYENMIAKTPCHSRQFLYHIHLEAGKQFSTITENGLKYAAFLPTSTAVINDIEFEAFEFIVFNSEGELIEINNYIKTATDIILFGGEPYNERTVMEGSFVMNTPHGITQAYNDYYDGKYGQLKIE